MRVAADAVLAAHFVFVLFVLLGGLFAIWRRWVVWLHIPAVIWAVAIEFTGWICPLTPLENALRVRGGGAGYEGDFIAHYLSLVLYPEHLTRMGQFVLGAFALAANTLIYAVIFRASRDRGRLS